MSKFVVGSETWTSLRRHLMPHPRNALRPPSKSRCGEPRTDGLGVFFAGADESLPYSAGENHQVSHVCLGHRTVPNRLLLGSLRVWLGKTQVLPCESHLPKEQFRRMRILLPKSRISLPKLVPWIPLRQGLSTYVE